MDSPKRGGIISDIWITHLTIKTRPVQEVATVFLGIFSFSHTSFGHTNLSLQCCFYYDNDL